MSGAATAENIAKARVRKPHACRCAQPWDHKRREGYLYGSALVEFDEMDEALAEPEKPYYYDHGDLNDAYLRGIAHARIAMLVLTGRLSLKDDE